MKLVKFVPLLFSVFLIVNCSKDETPAPKPDAEEQPQPQPQPQPVEPNEPEEEIYFSYHDDPNEFINSWRDNWMIIHNQDGELLDYRSFNRGDSLEFTGNTEKLENTSTLSITTLRYRPILTNGNQHAISTTKGVEKGLVWSWGFPTPISSTPSIPNPEGTNFYQYNITVNNVPNIAWHALVNESGLSTKIDEEYRESNILELSEIGLFSDIYNLLIIRDGNDQMKYSFLDLPDNATDIILDYDIDFLEFDTTLEIDLPEHTGYSTSIYANSLNTPYNNSIRIGNDDSFQQPRTKALLGYLTTFDWFRTYVKINYDQNTTYEYLYKGSVPEQIIVPKEPQLTIQNDNVYNFDFSTNIDYLQYNAEWFYHDAPNYNMTTYELTGYPEDSGVLGTLPEEILDRYPELNLGNLKHQETIFKFGRNPDIESGIQTSVLGQLQGAFIENISFSINED